MKEGEVSIGDSSDLVEIGVRLLEWSKACGPHILRILDATLGKIRFRVASGVSNIIDYNLV